MGLAGEQKPYGAFPFDAFLGKTTIIDSLPNAKDLEAMKLEGDEGAKAIAGALVTNQSLTSLKCATTRPIPTVSSR